MQKPKILVVEDDAGLQEALADTLGLAQYEVILAGNAEQALQQLKQHKIRLVVSDVQMGAISGLELLKSIKLNYPQLPVLMMTAYATVNDAVTAIRGRCRLSGKTLFTGSVGEYGQPLRQPGRANSV